MLVKTFYTFTHEMFKSTCLNDYPVLVVGISQNRYVKGFWYLILSYSNCPSRPLSVGLKNYFFDLFYIIFNLFMNINPLL